MFIDYWLFLPACGYVIGFQRLASLLYINTGFGFYSCELKIIEDLYSQLNLNQVISFGRIRTWTLTNKLQYCPNLKS